MALTVGTRVGPYEIIEPLGAGGMGEVYRAKDTRLNRTVAIKVLSSHLSANAGLKERFEREARAISSLSHSNICALYDIGSHDGIQFLVMEFLEGESLGQRLAKGPLPIDLALRYAVQIADALDKAHRQGIIHRDLKPGNIMLTKSGVKLLDFGLAKLQSNTSSPELAGVSLLATEARDITSEGTILGTLQYMAPEQLEGRPVDARADIFAFGSVLYEMVTGKKAFTGASQASLISAILKDEPAPISKVRPLSPPALDRIVKTCLEKDPEDRWQSAHDLMKELIWISESSTPTATSAGVSRVAKRERWLWAATVAVLLLGLAGLIFFYQQQSGMPSLPMRFSITLPEKSGVRAAALSPDGTRIVFVARDSAGKDLLWIRSLDSFALQPLSGTENPSFPFWSPDGDVIGFFADGKLKKIHASGGPPQIICDVPVGRGGSWNRDGVILYASSSNPLHRVSASGGPVTSVTEFNVKRGEDSHRWPFFLPDGKHFLYVTTSFGTGGQKENMGIYVAALDSKQEKFLTQAKSSVAYAPSGHLLFYRDGNLLAQGFDTESLRLTGDAFPVVEDVQYFPQTYNVLFSIAQNGSLIYQNRALPASQLTWFDRAGKSIGHVGGPADCANPRISPDGRRVAVDISDSKTGNADIWIYDSSGGIPTRFTSSPAEDTNPVWSRDAKSIIFASYRDGIFRDLFRKDLSGSHREEAILKSSNANRFNGCPTDWSWDDQFVLFRRLDPGKNLELWTMPMGGEQKPKSFLSSNFAVIQGQFSPDGRWVAYASNESGKWEIYVTPLLESVTNWRISSAGGTEPRWRRDGKELFYIAPNGWLMAVRVKEGSTFEADAATPLFLTRLRQHISATDLFSYDVSPDGQRFLMNTDVGETTAKPLNIVLNWAAQFKK
jgi:serine/threonine protein kinase